MTISLVRLAWLDLSMIRFTSPGNSFSWLPTPRARARRIIWEPYRSENTTLWLRDSSDADNELSLTVSCLATSKITYLSPPQDVALGSFDEITNWRSNLPRPLPW